MANKAVAPAATRSMDNPVERVVGGLMGSNQRLQFA
jgi:hypothetical protein